MTILTPPTTSTPPALFNEGDIQVKAEIGKECHDSQVNLIGETIITTATPPSPPVLTKNIKEEAPVHQNGIPLSLSAISGTAPLERPAMSKAREIRLEQNRKAARESRRRKKMMIEELQRSVIFFSRANGTLKQQNDELTRLLISAQAHVASIESGQCIQSGDKQGMAVAAPVTSPATTTPSYGNVAQQAQAQAVATQAMYESQGFPPAAARAAAQTMNAGVVVNVAAPPVATAPVPPATAPTGSSSPAPTSAMPPMQTGATMQAMASFQQAAAAAMQAAMGMNPATTPTPTQTAATPGSYADTINAIAMQQAAGAQFAVMQMQQQPTTYMSWQPQHQPAAAAPVAELQLAPAS